LAPFSSNVAMILANCEKKPFQRVLTMLQEYPIRLPECDDLVCDWNQLKNAYKEKIFCPFEEICAEKEDSKDSKQTS